MTQANIVLLLSQTISPRLTVFKIKIISSHAKHDFAGYITRDLPCMTLYRQSTTQIRPQIGSMIHWGNKMCQNYAANNSIIFSAQPEKSSKGRRSLVLNNL